MVVVVAAVAASVLRARRPVVVAVAEPWLGAAWAEVVGEVEAEEVGGATPPSVVGPALMSRRSS